MTVQQRQGGFEVAAMLGAGLGLIDGFRAQYPSETPGSGAWWAILVSVVVGAALLGVSYLVVQLVFWKSSRSMEAFQQRLVSSLIGTMLWASVGYSIFATITLVAGGIGLRKTVLAAFLLTSAVIIVLFRWSPDGRRRWIVLGLLVLSPAPFLLGLSGQTPLPGDIDRGHGLPPVELGDRDQLGPNILLVVLDTMRRDHMSLYGHTEPTTPFLEELAAESSLYLNAISPAPWTVPSHASMFTGQMPITHQARTERQQLASEMVTMAELLHARGYDTAGFTSNSMVSSAQNLQQGFGQYFEVFRHAHRRHPAPVEQLASTKLIRSATGRESWEDKGSARINRYVETWLDNWDDRGQSNPFFLFVNLLEPHLPYIANPEYVREYVDEPPRARIRELVSWDFRHSAILRITGSADQMEPDDYRQLAQYYDACIAYQDAQLRILFDGLRERGVLDDTLVLIVSDHGENLGEHRGLIGHHFSVHQNLLRVSLMVRYPKLFPQGARLDALVTTASVFPTLLQIAGVPPSEDWPPVYPPLPRVLAAPGVEFAISEYFIPLFELSHMVVENSGWDASSHIVRQRAIQDGEWKLIVPSRGDPQLYNLLSDPYEQHPLPIDDSPRGAELLAEMTQTLDSLPKPFLPRPSDAAGLDEETREALRALGYVD